VERKRRDNINECIAEFAKMVPDLQEQTKLNKGAILRKSVEYLEELQERTLKLEDQLQLALEQWRTTHHKCTQLMAHLSSSNEKMANLEKENQLLKEMIQVENQMKFSDYDENEGENGTQLKNTNHSQVLDSMKGFLVNHFLCFISFFLCFISFFLFLFYFFFFYKKKKKKKKK